MATGFQEQKGKKWDNVWGTLCIAQEPENVHRGRKAVEITHPQPGSRGADKRFESGFDTLYVRYYMKYAKEFPGCHHTGMAILGGAPGVTMGSATGVRPDGHNHFMALLDTVPPWSGWSPPPPGHMDIYCYHMDQGRKWGDLFFPTGEVYPHENESLFAERLVPRPNLTAQRDRWYCYELMVKANTPGKREWTGSSRATSPTSGCGVRPPSRRTSSYSVRTPAARIPTRPTGTTTWWPPLPISGPRSRPEPIDEFLAVALCGGRTRARAL
jgi:hypothetical protein